MLITFLFRLLTVCLLCIAQVLVCNQIHIMGYATPLIATLFFCNLPQNAQRIATLLWAFVLGLVIDIFSATPGEQAAALTLTAMVQWPLLRAMLPKDSAEDARPSVATLGAGKHFWYLLILASIHHLAFYALESFSMYRLLDTLIACLSSLALSMVIMLAVESLRKKKH